MIDIDFSSMTAGPLGVLYRDQDVVFSCAKDFKIFASPTTKLGLELPDSDLTIDLPMPASVVILEIYEQHAGKLRLVARDDSGASLDSKSPIALRAWVDYPLVNANGGIRQVLISGSNGEPLLARLRVL